jgi:phage tail sheath gpL-like
VAIADAGMMWKVPAPVLSLPAGTYNTDQNVTVTCTDAGAVLHYTTNGANPTEADLVVVSGGTVSVTQSVTLQVRAWKPGAVAGEVTSAAYELKALLPTFLPSTGSYTSAQTITISTGTAGSTVRYTADGTEPTTALCV